jgi:hypothetical protein
MAQITVKLSLRVAWWVRWYLAWVAVAARLTGAPPNIVKVERDQSRPVRTQSAAGRR